MPHLGRSNYDGWQSNGALDSRTLYRSRGGLGSHIDTHQYSYEMASHGSSGKGVWLWTNRSGKDYRYPLDWWGNYMRDSTGVTLFCVSALQKCYVGLD
jgi:hypothetical protein